MRQGEVAEASEVVPDSQGRNVVTPEQFVTWAEAVFGKYLPLMKAEVLRWMAPHTPWFIAGMRMTTLEGHPSVYGKPPGVYELEQFKVKAYEKGHTLEALASANKSTHLLDTDVAEEFVTPEEGERLFAEMRANLEKKLEKGS